MHADDKHPGLKKFREIRAREKQIAILREEIKVNNPSLTNQQVQEVAKASLCAKQASAPKAKRNKGKSKGKSKYSGRNFDAPTRSVKVEVVTKLTK